jgi:hypothetical protein
VPGEAQTDVCGGWFVDCAELPQQTEISMEFQILQQFLLPEIPYFPAVFRQFDSARRLVILCLWNVFEGEDATKETSR